MRQPTPHIAIEPLTREAFAPYGQVIEMPGDEQIAINRGKCIRHHALATVDLAGSEPEAVISIFAGQPYALPHTLDMVERHPLGSQAFYPLADCTWLMIVCDDDNGTPVSPRAFHPSPGQGVNLNRNQWHGVLTPIGQPADFLVVDRTGPGKNLEEHFFAEPYMIGG